MRWTIELLFREMQSSYRLEDMPSSKSVVVESLIYATILTLAVSRALFRSVAAGMKREQADRMPVERWGIVFASIALDILKILVGTRAIRQALRGEVLRYLRHEAVDPNASRKLLIDRVQQTSDHEAVRRA